MVVDGVVSPFSVMLSFVLRRLDAFVVFDAVAIFCARVDDGTYNTGAATFNLCFH